MRITVLGCSGSVVGPDSPASGYLLTAPDTPPLVMDFGPGVLGALQRHADPNEVHILLSHLHADHCLDLPGLFVWRRFHPSPAVSRGLVYGPAGTRSRLAAASSPVGEELDDFSDIFDVKDWSDGVCERISGLSVLPRRVCHPVESYGLRVSEPGGPTAVYSGDTGYCQSVVELAQGAEVFLCEASWTHSPERPRDLHLSGTEAGRVAAEAGVGELLLTHIPPWTSREEVIAEAKAEFDGPVRAVVAGEVIEVGDR